MRVQKRTILMSVIGAFLGFLVAILCMRFAEVNIVVLGIIIGIFTGYFVTLLISVSVYRSEKHRLLSEIMMLVTQTKSVCVRINHAKSYAFPDKVDILLHSYHKIKNSYTLLIKQLLDFEPFSKKCSKKIVQFSEDIYTLETSLKLQLRMNHTNMENSFPDLLKSLPTASIEEMEHYIAKMIFNAEQLKLYRNVEQACGDLLDTEQYLTGSC